MADNNSAQTNPGDENADKSPRVYMAIRDDIYARRWPFNTQLNLQEIADELKVSRTPVREALIRLSVEHCVQLRPGKGFFVRERHWREDLNDLEVLFALIRAMAERSISDFTGEGIVYLLKRYIKSASKDVTMLVLVVESIYDRIVSSAGNATATKLCRALTARTTFARSKFFGQDDKNAASIAILTEFVIELESQNIDSALKSLQNLYSQKYLYLSSHH